MVRIGIKGIEIGRVSLDRHPTLCRINLKYTEITISAIGECLIIGQHHVDIIALISDANELAGTIIQYVSAEYKRDVMVLANELIPHLHTVVDAPRFVRYAKAVGAPLVAGATAMQGVIGVQIGVGDYDDLAVGVIGYDLVGPVQNLIARAELECEDEPVGASSGKGVIAVIEPVRLEHAAEGGQSIVTADRKICIEKSCIPSIGGAVGSHVMIARQDRVWDHSIQQAEAFVD